MSNSFVLNNYSDFDRLLSGKVFLFTLLGTIGAFSLSYFQVFLEIPFPPYGLSLTYAVMILTVVYAKNIASSIVVALGGSIGHVSVTSDTVAEFFMGYLIVNLVVLILLGYFSDRLRILLSWNKFYLIFGIFFSMVAIGLSILFNTEASRFTELGYNIGVGGDMETGFPVIEIGWLVGLILLSVLFYYLTRGEMALADSSLTKYKLIGLLFILGGAAVTFVPFYLYGIKFSREELGQVAGIPWYLRTIDDLFSHQAEGAYAVYGDPISVFFIIATTTVLTMIGITLLKIGKNGGNMTGTKGGSETVFLAPPLFLLGYFAYSNYYVQNFLYPGGFFMGVELYPVYATMIWITLYINAWVARIVLLILDRL